jgi:hypothetical protein
LSKEPDTIEHLLGFFAHGVEPLFEGRVLPLELSHTLREADVRGSTFDGFDVFELGLRKEGATPERRELVGEMMDERLEITKGVLVSWRVV